jgi:hypothetical protein
MNVLLTAPYHFALGNVSFLEKKLTCAPTSFPRGIVLDDVLCVLDQLLIGDAVLWRTVWAVAKVLKHGRDI